MANTHSGCKGEAGKPAPTFANRAGIERLDFTLILGTLQRASSNLKESASILGSDRSTLYENVKRYEIPR
jgi:DNA-binding NtrC family response regulator